MTVAVCTLGCERKAMEGFPSWPYLFELQGDYQIYFNYEGGLGDGGAEPCDALSKIHLAAYGTTDLVVSETLIPKRQFSVDCWAWDTWAGKTWRKRPQFDQDQARLAPIVTARNMCRMFAQQTDASHLLFIDADIIPDLEIIPKLLEVNKPTVGGLVPGRGVHKDCLYVFGEKRRTRHLDSKGRPYELIECEHGNIGYCLIRRDVLEQIAFRSGLANYPDGRSHVVSDDPAFHLDAFKLLGEWHYIRTDVRGQHIGDLKADEVSQF